MCITSRTALAARWSVTVRVSRSYVTGVVASRATASGSVSASAGWFVSSGTVTAKLAAVSAGDVESMSSNATAIVLVLVNADSPRTGAVRSYSMRILPSSPTSREAVLS